MNHLLRAIHVLGPMLLAAAIPALAQPPSFHLKLDGVKMDYPGGEQWAEIKGPTNETIWAFAIYEGQQNWTVPLSVEHPGQYRLVRVERRANGQVTEVAVATGSDRILDINVAAPAKPAPPSSPLVQAGEFNTFYAAEEPWCLNDHTLVQGPDRTWHLFAITHPKPLDFFKDPGRQLAHATATNLLQKPWQTEDFAVRRDWEKHREYLLWAPHVIRHQDLYYMYVCVGDQSTHRYRIHLLTSPDLKAWTRSPDNPMVVDGFDGRDPFVTRVGEQWVMYYTANSTPEGGNHLVACVTSRDLKHWGNRQVVFIHPRAGSFGGPTESPFVVRRGNHWYLFACDNDWTDVYLSNDPFHWDFRDKNTRIHSHASEITRDSDGQWYITHAGWMSGPLKIAPLKWMDGLDRQSTNILPAEK